MSLDGAIKKTAGKIVSSTAEDGDGTKLGKLMNLENLSSRIIYENILNGVDLEYIVNGRNVKEKTSDMAERVGAIVAVNGDYYGAREMGFVIRNGVLHRVAPDTDLESLVIMDDGSFKVVSQQTTRAIDLFKSGARHAFTFGPGLLSEGEITVSRIDEVDQSMKSNPRTAIGQIGENHYVLVVSDGRTDASYGLSLYNLAKFMKTLGVKVGYNLDGGGSSTMYFKGKIVNYPTTNGDKFSERSVSDIVYIGY